MNWLQVGTRTLPSVARLTIRALRNASREGAMDISKARQAMSSRDSQLEIARDAAKVRELEKVTKRLYEEAGTTPQEVAKRVAESKLANRPRDNKMVHRKLTPEERARYENPLTEEQLDALLEGYQPDPELRAKEELKKAIPNPFQFK
tara:strand:- start:1393 stop:1836 length:444 start_codon:yes stop_codon:yes gene_type:complete